jgi:hypothetical protein
MDTMRINFHSPISDNIAFQHAFHREFAAKAVPKWFQLLSALILFVGLGAITYELFPQPDRIIALYLFIGLFCWLLYKGYDFCYRLFASRYLTDSIDADVCVAEVSDGRYSTENRGIRMSFPLSALTLCYERDNYVYLYFGRLGAARIPYKAFESGEHRAAFLDLVRSSKNVAMQTPASGTPPAGAPTTPPPGTGSQ